MRWRTLAMLAGVAAMTSMAAANAQDEDTRGLFVGFGLESLNLDASGTDGDGTSYDINSKPLDATLRVGYYLVPWLSLDVHAATGIHDAENDGSIAGGQDVRNGDTELKYLYGAAVKPQYQFTYGGTSTFTLFALAGYSKFKFEGSAEDNVAPTPAQADFSIDDNGVYYGGGISIDGAAASFIFQYINYFDDNDIQLEGFSLSVNKYF